MKNLVLNSESSEEESKAHSAETTASVYVAETKKTLHKSIQNNVNPNELKTIVCFRWGKPNHLA